MIRFSFTDHRKFAPGTWFLLNVSAAAEYVRFDGYRYAIQNVIYNERTPEFIEAFNKERVWEKLTEEKL